MIEEHDEWRFSFISCLFLLLSTIFWTEFLNRSRAVFPHADCYRTKNPAIERRILRWTPFFSLRSEKNYKEKKDCFSLNFVLLVFVCRREFIPLILQRNFARQIFHGIRCRSSPKINSLEGIFFGFVGIQMAAILFWSLAKVPVCSCLRNGDFFVWRLRLVFKHWRTHGAILPSRVLSLRVWAPPVHLFGSKTRQVAKSPWEVSLFIGGSHTFVSLKATCVFCQFSLMQKPRKCSVNVMGHRTSFYLLQSSWLVIP